MRVIRGGEFESCAARESSHGRFRHGEKDAESRLRRDPEERIALFHRLCVMYGAAAYHAIERSCDAGLAQLDIRGMQLSFGGKLISLVAGHLGLGFGELVLHMLPILIIEYFLRPHGIGSA